MAALIEFVCIAMHGSRGDPSITLEQKTWAYCSAGASAGHEWTRIDPTAVEALRTPAGKSRTRLVPDEDAEGVASRRTK